MCWRSWVRIPLLSTDSWALVPQVCSDLPATESNFVKLFIVFEMFDYVECVIYHYCMWPVMVLCCARDYFNVWSGQWLFSLVYLHHSTATCHRFGILSLWQITCTFSIIIFLFHVDLRLEIEDFNEEFMHELSSPSEHSGGQLTPQSPPQQSSIVMHNSQARLVFSKVRFAQFSPNSWSSVHG